jgi:hypothetical protein
MLVCTFISRIRTDIHPRRNNLNPIGHVVSSTIFIGGWGAKMMIPLDSCTVASLGTTWGDGGTRWCSICGSLFFSEFRGEVGCMQKPPVNVHWRAKIGCADDWCFVSVGSIQWNKTYFNRSTIIMYSWRMCGCCILARERQAPKY